MATETAAQFGAQAQPVEGVVFGETTEFDREIDVPQTAQLAVIGGLARCFIVADGTGAKAAHVDQGEACIVAHALETAGVPARRIEMIGFGASSELPAPS